METIGVAILGFIIIVFLVAIIIGIGSSVGRASNAREYTKTMRRSTGLEKIRLLVRDRAPVYTGKLKKSDGSSWPNLSLPIATSHLLVADGYYEIMQDTFNKLGRADEFDEMAEAISTDFSQQETISARIFGIAFGISVAKAANMSNRKIKKTAVKKYLNSCNFDADYKKEIVKMATAYIDFEQDELFGAHSEAGFTSQDLGVMAYALINAKLGKNNYPDPTFSTAMNMAIAIAYKEAYVNDSLIKEFKDEGLIG